jgi:hypothetical protein
MGLGAGFTALRRAENLGERLGIERLWIKDDTSNPTASFKDRVVTVALTMSNAFGFEAVACALHREPRERDGGPRGEGRHPRVRVHPVRPGAREGAGDRRRTARTSSPSTATTTT